MHQLRAHQGPPASLSALFVTYVLLLFPEEQVNFRRVRSVISIIAMRFTYLINVNTGATWELVEDQQTTEDYFCPIFER